VSVSNTSCLVSTDVLNSINQVDTYFLEIIWWASVDTKVSKGIVVCKLLELKNGGGSPFVVAVSLVKPYGLGIVAWDFESILELRGGAEGA
jgi:hypothetical protein